MGEQFSTIGGARIGWVNATWPFARLAVSAARLKISGLLGTYDFGPGEVVALEPLGSIPGLTTGVRIIHARSDYPAKIVFWCLSPDRLIRRVWDTGFLPSAPSDVSARWRGVPIRWPAIIVFVVAWNIVVIELGWVAFVLAILVSWAIRTSPRFQRWVISEGHSAGEIKPHLALMQTVCGLMLIILAMILIFEQRSVLEH